MTCRSMPPSIIQLAPKQPGGHMTNDWRHSLFNSQAWRRLLSQAPLRCVLSVAAAEAGPDDHSNMPGLTLSSDQPIQIESDKLEIHDQEQPAVFTGNVKVVQGTTTMQAGKMTVFYKKAKQPAATPMLPPSRQPDNPRRLRSLPDSRTSSLVSGDADIDHILVTDKVYLVSGTQTATAR